MDARAEDLQRWLSPVVQLLSPVPLAHVLAVALSLFSGESQVVEASDASDAVLGEEGRQLPCPCPSGCVCVCG